MSGRGSGAVQCLVVQSVDLGYLEGVPIRHSIPDFLRPGTPWFVWWGKLQKG